MPGDPYRLGRKRAADGGQYLLGGAASDVLVGQRGLSLNCILNFLHGASDDAVPGGNDGRNTFGEIAYLLMNQTLVHTRLETEVIEQAA